MHSQYFILITSLKNNNSTKPGVVRSSNLQHYPRELEAIPNDSPGLGTTYRLNIRCSPELPGSTLDCLWTAPTGRPLAISNSTSSKPVRVFFFSPSKTNSLFYLLVSVKGTTNQTEHRGAICALPCPSSPTLRRFFSPQLGRS